MSISGTVVGYRVALLPDHPITSVDERLLCWQFRASRRNPIRPSSITANPKTHKMYFSLYLHGALGGLGCWINACPGNQ
jgi:hypothetical protein